MYRFLLKHYKQLLCWEKEANVTMKAITHLNLRERLPVTLTMEESGPTRTWKKTLPSTSVRGESVLSEQSS